MKSKLLRIATLAALVLVAMMTGHTQNVPITLEQGWNWISYPHSEAMTISEALSGFTPSEGDVLKSQTGMAQYQGGVWIGDLTTLTPGKGYMYQSADGTSKSFVFGGTANDPSALPEAALDGEFTVDANGTKVRFSPGNLQCRIDPSVETQAIVGTSSSTMDVVPYDTYYRYSLCQIIYKAEELTAAGIGPGPITSIAFESYSTNHYLRNGITIWMSSTTLTEAPSTSVSTLGMTQTFTGSLVQQEGWTPIYFSTPFTWDGESNLMVTVLMNHGSWNSKTSWNCTRTSYFSYGRTSSDSNGGYDPSSTTYSVNQGSYRPNTRFNGKGGVTWRFAEKQWNVIGAGNNNMSSSYTGWIDLFGWGTSGHPHGANCFQPWSTGMTDHDYYAYGDVSYNLYDQTGEADWGCNPISNGGDKPNQWRTLTKDEWAYVINTRTTSSGKRYAKAQVDGVNGLILLPNDWKTSYYTLNSTNSSGAAFTSNTITATQWQTLEQKGAVFLPAGGFRFAIASVEEVGDLGSYWTSSTYEYAYSDASSIGFDNSIVSTTGAGGRSNGYAVRLVCQSNPRIRTIGVSNVTSTGATVSVEVDWTGNTVPDRGICYNATGNPVLSDGYTSSGTGTGSFNVTLTGLQPNTTYYVRSFAHISSTYRYGNTLTFTTPDDGCNGHSYVDLGLPSGLLWATCNLGATNPEDYGSYFAWGETQTKSDYSWSTYQYSGNGSNTTMTKYCDVASYGYNGYVDNLNTLLPEDDVATTKWGEGWRMPTEEEFEELYNNTTVIWTQQNGVNGRLFTASNGNSLFLPAAGCRSGSSLDNAGDYGYYWSSSLVLGLPASAWHFRFYSDNGHMNGSNRVWGFSIRAVRSGQN